MALRRRRAVKRKSPARKRIMRKRTARKNPARKRIMRKRTARKAAPRKRVARKAAPRKTMRRRARRNPASSGWAAQARRSVISGEIQKLREEAKRRGLKASGSAADIKARIAAQERRGKAAGKKTNRRGRKMTRAGAQRRAAAGRRTTGKHSRSAKAILRKVKVKKGDRSPAARRRRNKRRIARGYLKARGVAKAVPHMSAENKKLAKAYGLTQINPGIKGAIKDVKAMVVPTILPAASGFVGGAFAGQYLGTMLGEKVAFVSSRPALKRAAVPTTTAGLTVAAFMVLKRSKKMQRAAMPVLVGGGIATVVHWLLHTLTGQKVASALRLPFALSQASEAQVAQVAADAASGKEPTAGGMASYVSVRQYLGETMLDPKGGSWYGRSDMGEYVDAGPQNAFGAYVASDFPVHSPGPGDNDNTFATLGAYETPEYAFDQTPGGTVIEPVGEIGGLFDRKSAIG